MINTKYCIACGKELKNKNEIGINLKLLGDNRESFFCIDCLATYLEVSIEDIYDKIEFFRDEGCSLFK